jgi:hypothetical protein
MAIWICDQCGQPFKRKKSRLKAVKTCSRKCVVDWKKANNITDGQFKPGQRPASWVAVGAIKIRKRHNRNESPRAWVKIAEPNVWELRAKVVWEQAHGAIPEGFLVHHKDRNALNDRLDNLELLTRAAHLAEHRHEQDEQKRSESMKAAWVKRRERMMRQDQFSL